MFVDEFTYILKATPEIAGILQNLWDHVLSKTNLFLCLSGSHLGMMKREFLSCQAPAKLRQNKANGASISWALRAVVGRAAPSLTKSRSIYIPFRARTGLPPACGCSPWSR